MAIARPRGVRSRPGQAQRVGLALAGLAVVGLIFTVGVLVGRHWARPSPGLAATETQKRPSAAARRGGLADSEVERARESAEKLTFYQTLTAPLVPPASYAKPNGDAKAKPPLDRSAPAREPGGPRAEPAGSAPTPASEDRPRVATAPADPGPSAGSESAQTAAVAPSSWSVQVGAFRSRPQADAVQRELRESGFEAWVTTLGAADGQMRYRVRVGSFASRAEAERVAERVRAERSLPTFVVSN